MQKNPLSQHEPIVVAPVLKQEKVDYPPPKVTWYNGCIYKCDACPHQTSSPKTISSHIRYKHGLPLHKGQVNNHRIKYEEFECQVCDMVLPKISERVTNHLKKHHELSREEYQEKFIAEVEVKEETRKEDLGNVRRSKRKLAQADNKKEAADEGISESNAVAAIAAEVDDEVDQQKISSV